MAFLWVSTANLWPQTNDLPELDSAKILQELSALVEKNESQQKALLQKQVNTLKPATQSGQAAVKLYEDAVKESGSKRDQRGQEITYNDWRRTHAEELRSDSFQAAAQLHARYLQMALEYDPENKSASANASWEYAQALARILSDPKLAPSSISAKELLLKPAKDSVISQWLGVSPRWPSDKFWAPQAGNLAGILDKNVRSVWLEQRDPRLLTMWDLQIRTSEESASRDSTGAENFTSIQKPQLLFNRARDMAKIGQPNRAATEILLIAQEHPNHPDFSTWVNELKSLLTPAPAAPILEQ